MVRAIIFDLDGTLADTESLHYAAFAEVLRSEGTDLSRAHYFKRLIGYNDHDCLVAVLSENAREASKPRVSELMARKARAYQAMITDRDVLYQGAEKFVRACATQFPLIIATGTLRDEAEMILRGAHLRDLFVDVIAAEDVERGKPEPDSFIAALDRLRFRLREPIAAHECLVVEDAPAGIEAAHRARMKVLALCHTTPASELAAADLVRNSFADTDLDDILRRLSS